MLQALVEDPTRRLSEYPLMTDAERQTSDRIERDGASCRFGIHESIAKQAPHTRRRAVSFGGKRLTYAELECRANQLANRLHDLGVGPEVRVGICLERSPDFVIAILAVMKAGGAYVPLDASHPFERLAFLMSDSGASVLLTTDGFLPRFPNWPGAVACVDSAAADLPSQPAAAPSSAVAMDNLAYVIYTSGSTGTPKGVAVSHRSVANHAAAVAEHYGLGSGDRVLQFASPAFDVAVEEILPTLLTGGTVVIPTATPGDPQPTPCNGARRT